MFSSELKGAYAAVLAVFVLAGCGTPNRAPVEIRNAGGRTIAEAPVAAPPAAAASAADTAKLQPGAENAGKPGYYTARPGDTLIRIALETGQNWRDLAKWNKLDNPNVVEVGQVLRVIPPGVDPNGASARPIASAKVEVRPLDAKGATASGAAASSAPVAAAPPAAPEPKVARTGDDDINWAWPAAGKVLSPYDENKTKGLSIGGKAGDPVYAAADGRVVYAGAGLRGYGNLVIIKHNPTYLTAYAHNKVLLVKDDQAVRRGQQIAEMGSTDSDHVNLHFEIRKKGKPIDPAKLLPPR
ncbi:MAG TPA: peptidoglycan DD-metalloendopeptidase family protein [Burkholderiaceae bacterium]|nr:peptidoglycan DD-metalloendopeptidase family protein [Burkholderiaceae bacterium]